MLLGLDARYGGTQGLYLEGRLVAARTRQRVRRSVLIGDTLQDVQSLGTDTVLRVTLELGGRLPTAHKSFTPYLAFSALRIHQGRFTEAGAGGFGLTVRAQRHRATLAEAGLRYARDIDWAGGRSTLGGYLGYDRVVGGTGLGYAAAFAGAPRAVFDTRGQSLPRQSARLGLTLSTAPSPQWSWFVNLEGEAAPARSHGFDMNAGVRVAL